MLAIKNLSRSIFPTFLTWRQPNCTTSRAHQGPAWRAAGRTVYANRRALRLGRPLQFSPPLPQPVVLRDETAATKSGLADAASGLQPSS